MQSPKPTHIAAWVFVVALAAPTALADPTDGILPPTDVQSAYHGDTDHIRLTWSPVEGADWYNVYRNGQFIDSTPDPWYVADLDLSTLGPVAGFQVTSVHVPVTAQSGPGSAPVESGPSAPVLYGQAGACAIGSTSIEPDNPPFVHTDLHPECLPIGTEGTGITVAWRMFS